MLVSVTLWFCFHLPRTFSVSAKSHCILYSRSCCWTRRRVVKIQHAFFVHCSSGFRVLSSFSSGPEKLFLILWLRIGVMDVFTTSRRGGNNRFYCIAHSFLANFPPSLLSMDLFGGSTWIDFDGSHSRWRFHFCSLVFRPFWILFCFVSFTFCFWNSKQSWELNSIDFDFVSNWKLS